ncbi:hypothetical protein ACF09I_31315 [Streptomyces sp. NPDC014940]|uniref:hypothetical protein n=1 Tax=Streptomyces sp. NPDC014940 TaxID=3364932 RepID=UPI0036FD6D1B
MFGQACSSTRRILLSSRPWPSASTRARPVNWVRAAFESDKRLVEQLGLEKEVNNSEEPEDDEE